MISTTQVETKFYQLLISKGIHEMITGNIYKSYRDFQDDLENIEINILNTRNAYVQTGFLNCNLYIQSQSDDKPNTARFDELTALMIPLIESVVYGNVRFQIDSQSGVLRDETHDKLHFINFKFNFQTI